MNIITAQGLPGASDILFVLLAISFCGLSSGSEQEHAALEVMPGAYLT